MTLTQSINSYGGFNPGAVYQKAVTLAQGDNDIVSGIASKQIQIVGLHISSDTAGIATLKSGDDTIATLSLADTGGFSKQAVPNGLPLFCCSTSEDLSVNIAPAITNVVLYIQYRIR